VPDPQSGRSSSTIAGSVYLLGAAALFSTGGAAIKATALNSWQVASARSLIAAAAILLLMPSARPPWNWRVLLAGAPYAATLILFVSANKLTTSANAIFLQATAPLYLLLLGPLILGERIPRSGIVMLVILALGLSLFFLGEQQPLSTAPDPMTGNILGALSGLTWALVLVSLRRLQMPPSSASASPSPPPSGVPAIAAVVAGNLIAAALCLPMAFPYPATAASADWLVLAYLGVFQIGLAYVMMTRGIRDVPALEASLLLLLEPALNPLWSLLVHGERPGPWSIAGGILILSATLGRVLWNRPPSQSKG
jgi:drug/metabolite transporter, DME family